MLKIEISGADELEELESAIKFFEDMEGFAVVDDGVYNPYIAFLSDEETALERYTKLCEAEPKCYLRMCFIKDNPEGSAKAIDRSYQIKDGEVIDTTPKEEDFQDDLSWLDSLPEDEDEDEE